MYKKGKCERCGLVNPSSVRHCSRCDHLLESVKTNFEPSGKRNKSKTFFTPRMIGLLIVLVLCVAGSWIYQNGQMKMIKAYEVVNEQKRQDNEKLQKMEAAWKNPVVPYKKTEPKSMSNTVPMQHRPYVPPGGFGPPGAGVPYHTR
jgi:hypothetical protein